jgi:hypothetical protein
MIIAYVNRLGRKQKDDAISIELTPSDTPSSGKEFGTNTFLCSQEPSTPSPHLKTVKFITHLYPAIV